MEKHHNLAAEFPQYAEKIHTLKMENSHFRKIFDQYNQADADVHRIESGAEATTDEHLNELRLKRVKLKDELYSLLQ